MCSESYYANKPPWNLSETCPEAKLTYYSDNLASVVFTFFMSIWATLFLEIWKRRAADLSYRWGLSDYTTRWEHPHPVFLSRLTKTKNKKINVNTGQIEPVVSYWRHTFPIMSFGYVVVTFFIIVVLVVVCSIEFLQMKLTNVLNDKFDFPTWMVSIIVSAISGILNLVGINTLNEMYSRVANYLTTLESPRTKTEFDRSLTIKLFVFQFINNYAPIIYIAFFKGKIYTEKILDQFRRFGLQPEECKSGACSTELTIQLAIIMCGQQFYDAIMEMVVPAVSNWFRRYSFTKKTHVYNFPIKTSQQPRWAEDYTLLAWDELGLCSEYLEIVIQFGFVTLFAASFPLAPLLALINNILELRFDAQKVLKYYRRPVPYLVTNLDLWYRIFDIISKLAVFSNAAIIAFSYNFIPLLIFQNEWDDGKRTCSNFMEYSTFAMPYNSSMSPENATCRRFGYRPDDKKYKIWMFRFVFMFVFQNGVLLSKTVAQWLIPDVPRKLIERKRRDGQLVTELKIKHEKELIEYRMRPLSKKTTFSRADELNAISRIIEVNGANS